MGLAVGLAFYLDSASLVCVAVGLPVWRAAFALSAWQVGVLGGGLAMALAAGSLTGGLLGDRVGRLRVFTVDLAVFVVGTLVLLTASGPATLVAGVLLVGVAAGADMPTGLAVLALTGSPQSRARRTGATQVAWIGAILITYGLAVAVAGLGLLGIRILVGHLMVLAVLALLVRTRRRPADRSTRPRHPDHAPARTFVAIPGREIRPVALVTAFYITWSAAATTLGSYGAYFLVTVTQMDQRAATSLVLVGFLPAAGMALLFTRLAATRWRERLFPVAALLQVLAFALGAVTAGRSVAAMAATVVLYSLSNVFGGEAAYKVWGQQLFAERFRATALGASYAAARVVSAIFLLVVPTLLAIRPTGLLWLLTGFVGLSGLIGLRILRYRRGQEARSGHSEPGLSEVDIAHVESFE